MKIEFSETFKRAFGDTYQAIGHDIEASLNDPHYGETDPKERKVIMAESIVDANRMQMFGGDDGKTAEAELMILITQHGWDAVRTAAAEQLL